MNKFSAGTAVLLAALALPAAAAGAKEEKTASGILITQIKAGTGASPKSTVR